jgi:hypothetical protein
MACGEATLLHIARLTDPPRTGGKDNLTINKLPNLIADATLIAVCWPRQGSRLAASGGNAFLRAEGSRC